MTIIKQIEELQRHLQKEPLITVTVREMKDIGAAVAVAKFHAWKIKREFQKIRDKLLWGQGGEEVH